MATVTTRLPALLTYLVNAFTTSALIGAATPPVTVYDGPQVTEFDPPLKLFVGLTDPDIPGAEPAGDSQQTWGALGRLGRNETVTVSCCAEAWGGGPGDQSDIQATRANVYGIVAAVESVMQADTTQFGGNVLYPAPGATNERYSQNTEPKGTICRVTFDLIFYCRIGGF